MQEDIDDSTLRKIDPSQNFLWKWISCIGKSGGILVGINLEHLDVGSFIDGEFMLQLNLWDKKLKAKGNHKTVHGAAHEDRKEAFLSELANFCGKNKEPYTLGGDFNIIRFAHEKKNKAVGNNRHINTFNAIISADELRKISMTGGKFT